MAKKFTDKNPLKKLEGNVSQGQQPQEPDNGYKATATEKKAKKKAGRPKIKTEETKTINIAVPVSTLEKIDIAKICYNNNLTQYINTLIEHDIEINYDKYNDIAENLKNFR